MIGRPIKRQTDTLQSCFHGRMSLNIEAKVTGDRVNLGRIERDAAAVDGDNELPGVGIVGKRGCLTEKQGL